MRSRETVEWIEALTGAPLIEPGDLHASLKVRPDTGVPLFFSTHDHCLIKALSLLVGLALQDGVALCQLLNAAVPGTIPEKRINKSTAMPFKQMENISNFLKAARALGVREHDLFETVDLFDGKDIGLVIQCLHSLGTVLQVKLTEQE